MSELITKLNELAKEKKYVAIQICPKCKNPLIRRVDSTNELYLVTWALFHLNINVMNVVEASRLMLKATNKSTTVQEVVIMAEANEVANSREKKRNFFDYRYT